MSEHGSIDERLADAYRRGVEGGLYIAQALLARVISRMLEDGDLLDAMARRAGYRAEEPGDGE